MIDKKSIRNAPKIPGVYTFFSKETPIYIGKAKDLKSRLSSYFLKNAGNKAKEIVKKADKISWTIVNSELEAIILEYNLIQEKKPRYNVIFRDDKSFLFIKISYSDDFPKIELTRKPKNLPGSTSDLYLGPFTNSEMIKKLLEFAQSIFNFRTCKKELKSEKDGFYKPKENEKPCLLYHLGKCKGPCIGKISKKDYKEIIDEAASFLKGNFGKAKEILKDKMTKLASEKKFELAAQIRDILNFLEEIQKKQVVFVDSKINADFIGVKASGNFGIATILQVRSGKLIGKESLEFDIPKESAENEILEKAIVSYYLSASFIPDEIFLPFELEDSEIIKKAIFGDKKIIRITFPKSGKKRKILELATKNSEDALKQKTPAWKSLSKIDEKEDLKELSCYLKSLDEKTFEPAQEIKRIECFDVSHMSGSFPIASMVVFEDGKEKKSHYRKFNLVSTPKNDDYSGLKEAIKRRFDKYNEMKILAEDLNNKKHSISKLEYILKEENANEEKKKNAEEEIKRLKTEIEKSEKNLDKSFLSLPDVLLIDGGKSQLSAVFQVLSGIFKNKIPFFVFSIAKKEEEIFFGENLEKLDIKKDSEISKLFQRIRDEAHRFAIFGNRRKREKEMVRSKLDDIKGIGPKLKKKLLEKFGSLENIKKAKLEEIAKVVGEKRAKEILKNL